MKYVRVARIPPSIYKLVLRDGKWRKTTVSPRGYVMTKAEAQAAREAFIKNMLVPACQKWIFKKDPYVAAVTMFIAQYWNDNASDEVHLGIISHKTDEVPILDEKSRFIDENDFKDEKNCYDYNVPSDVEWHGNSGVEITLWSCFAHGHGAQDNDYAENFTPAATIKRDGSFEFHPQVRPWLDGVMTAWDMDWDPSHE